MSYIGSKPTSVPLTSSDITDGIISTAKIADDAVTAAKAAFSPGKVLQVLESTNTTSFNTTSASYVDTGIACPAITLASTSSKVLVRFVVNSHGNCAGSTDPASSFSIYKTVGGTTSSVQDDISRFRFSNNAGMVDCVQVIELLISPSTTSEITFKLYMKSVANTPYINPSTSLQTSTIMEVA